MNISAAEKDYIDIHSHLKSAEEDVFRIMNVFSADFKSLPPDQCVSIGLHPWHLNESAIEALPGVLDQALKLPAVKAVGEAGMDRLIRINMEKQQEVFVIHIKYAIEYNKPLIIHCVRAYTELIELKTRFGSEIPWIIHGFNGNKNIAEELISRGFYLSVGNRLLKDEDKSARIIQYIPPSGVFIESDEDTVPVKDLYAKVAKIYRTDVLSLQRMIRDNYMRLFKD